MTVNQQVHNLVGDIPELEYDRNIETNTTTDDINIWLDAIKSESVNDFYNFDYVIVNNASLYALSPVILLSDGAKAMTQDCFDSLEEIKNYLQGKKYILYRLIERIKTGEINKETFEIDKFETPKLVYIFRGYILE